jgi:RNA 2',3'-cyclic 3'-phosphodiesterase
MKKLSDSGTKRIFIAIKLVPGEKLVALFSHLRTSLSKEKIKWTETGNLHVTMAFLGDTEVNRLPAIREKLIQLCKGSGSFDMVIKGAGVFKNFKDPRVIWVGIEPSDALIRLFDAIKKGLGELEIRLEERSFNPHLTLGRIKYLSNPAALATLVSNIADSEFQTQKVEKIILYESVLLPSGPLYKPLAEIGL